MCTPRETISTIRIWKVSLCGAVLGSVGSSSILGPYPLDAGSTPVMTATDVPRHGPVSLGAQNYTV